MRVKINKEEVIEGLLKAAGIIPSKTGAAYLRSIWLKAANGLLSVMSTDANIEFCGAYPATIEKEGLVGVQGRVFVDLLRKLPSGEISLTLEDGSNTLILEQGRRKYKMPIGESKWYQDFALFPEENAIMWTADFLQDIIERTIYCISDEENSGAIACLLLKPIQDGKIDACGLNGHQFAQVCFTNDDLFTRLPQEGVLIHKKYLAEIKKWLGSDEIDLNISDKRLHLRSGDKKERLSLPLAYHQYPDYSNFLSKIHVEDVSTLKISRKESVNALDRLTIFSSATQPCVYFNMAEKEATLFAEGQDVGAASESIEAHYDGSITKIGFATKKLIEIMAHFQSEDLNLTITGTEGPCGIKGESDPDYTVIIMPMKIAEVSYYTEENA